jgi:hypothetical protein
VWEKKEDEHVDTSGHLESDPRYFHPSFLLRDISLNESRLDAEVLLDEVVCERLTLLKALQTASKVSSTRKSTKEKAGKRRTLGWKRLRSTQTTIGGVEGSHRSRKLRKRKKTHCQRRLEQGKQRWRVRFRSVSTKGGSVCQLSRMNARREEGELVTRKRRTDEPVTMAGRFPY